MLNFFLITVDKLIYNTDFIDLILNLDNAKPFENIKFIKLIKSIKSRKLIAFFKITKINKLPISLIYFFYYNNPKRRRI